MKLNLLPTYVGKEKAVKSAIFLSAIIAAVGIGASVFMITSSREAVRVSQEKITNVEGRAREAVAKSKEADAILANARVLILNTNLAAAMNKHNSDYIALYDEVRRYIPSYFRVTSMAAAPAGADSTVTLQGVIQTQQQYADLMLALMRIPGARSVSRTGYQIVEQVVPPLVEGSQRGDPIPAGSQPLPDDPLQRLDYYISQPKTEGFLDANGFGRSDPSQPKGAMPNWSLITVSVVLPRDIQTPNPQATLATVGGASAGGGGGTGTVTTPPGIQTGGGGNEVGR